MANQGGGGWGGGGGNQGGWGQPPPGYPQQPQQQQQGGYPQNHPAAQAPNMAPGYAPMMPQQPRAMGQTSCQACGRVAPVKHVTFMQNVGVLIVRFPKTIRGMLCKRCISKYFWQMTLITFFFGWWGIISFFYSLVSIPANIGNYLGARSLPDQ